MTTGEMLRSILEKVDKAVEDGLIALTDEQKAGLTRLQELSVDPEGNQEEIMEQVSKLTNLLLGR